MTALAPQAGRLDVAGVSTAIIDTGPSSQAGDGPAAPPVLLLHGSGPRSARAAG